jgi:hypothetical protein
MGGFVIPWLGILSIAPKWSAGFVLTTSLASAPSSGKVRAVPTPTALLASTELPRGQVTLEGSHGGLRRPVERPTLEVTDAEQGAGSWPSRLATLSWDAFALAGFAAASAGMAAWWLLGQILLWRVTRAAGPVSPEIHEVFRAISGPAGQAVRLLESDWVDLLCGSAWRTSALASSATTLAPGTSRPSPGSCYSIRPCSGGYGGN